jgi:hypothetical protein
MLSRPAVGFKFSITTSSGRESMPAAAYQTAKRMPLS